MPTQLSSSAIRLLGYLSKETAAQLLGAVLASPDRDISKKDLEEALERIGKNDADEPKAN